jgi:cysteine sulfinate desulfinase/cysteine desulfurase-like protein/glyoxylase-like metal-dependent hydrolase (beta-lactamase superfamily II)/rhodanese-related sulfurtransferase
LYLAIEHKAVPQAMHHWVNSLGMSCKVVEIPVDSKGLANLDFIKEHASKARMVCTMAVNNETGVVQDLDKIAQALSDGRCRGFWLVDSVQALGKVEIKLASKNRPYPIHYASFSGHKLYAPKGVGFLYARKCAPLHAMIVGGGQEKGLRSGTENLPGVAAVGAVLASLLPKDQKTRISCSDASRNFAFSSDDRLYEFRGRILSALRAAFPQVCINTPLDVSVPTCINFSVPGLTSKEILDLFDSAGVRLSAGSACSSSSVKPSHVLQAMGLEDWICTSACRLSFGPATTEADIEAGCRAIKEAAVALQSCCLLSCGDRGLDFEAPATLRDGVVQFRGGASNTWVLVDRESRTAVIVDPLGSDSVAERLENYVRCQGLKILTITDTHSHQDHVSVRPVVSEFLRHHFLCPGGPVDALGWPSMMMSDDACVSTAMITVTLENGMKASAIRMNLVADAKASLCVARIHTPGHTEDSHTILAGIVDLTSLTMKSEDIRFAFVGDLVLSGGLGRTNFTSSDPVALFHSLRMLKSILGSKTLLCPAHDYGNSFATRFSLEMVENELLQSAVDNSRPLSEALSKFLEMKEKVDERLAKIEETFQGTVCGVVSSAALQASDDISLSWPRLLDALKSNPQDVVVVDVREPQEYAVWKQWEDVGLHIAPRSVPLSRIVNLMSEVLQEAPKQVVLICRSGNRSLQAAKAMRRLGCSSVYNLDGGVAMGVPAHQSR